MVYIYTMGFNIDIALCLKPSSSNPYKKCRDVPCIHVYELHLGDTNVCTTAYIARTDSIHVTDSWCQDRWPSPNNSDGAITNFNMQLNMTLTTPQCWGPAVRTLGDHCKWCCCRFWSSCRNECWWIRSRCCTCCNDEYSTCILLWYGRLSQTDIYRPTCHLPLWQSIQQCPYVGRNSESLSG